jgi:hypothetical protein
MLTGATHQKIEAHMRKHRASGGHLVDNHVGKESPQKGNDEADEDLKDKPKDRSAGNNVGPAAEAKKVEKKMTAKKGGFMKKEAKAEGEKAHHHAGRRHRASGGHCEDSPFTMANRATLPKGRKVEKMSEGKDEE